MEVTHIKGHTHLVAAKTPAECMVSENDCCCRQEVYQDGMVKFEDAALVDGTKRNTAKLSF
jgi:hypothetical protein